MGADLRHGNDIHSITLRQVVLKERGLLSFYCCNALYSAGLQSLYLKEI